MKLPSLTGVRGIAALWVVLFHLQQFAGEFGLDAVKGLPGLRSGWAGVDLFFVLSGFILMLVHERDFPRLSWSPLFRFAWLRFFRVYPLATVVLLLILLLVVADPQFAAYWSTASVPHNFTVSSFVRTLFLANRWWSPTDGDWNQPEWSLSVEILGYVAFPVIAVIATRIRNVRLLLGLVVLCLLFPTAYAYASHGKLFNDDIFWGAGSRMAGAFTGGIVLARLHRLTPEGWRDLQGSIATSALVALGACLCLPPYGYGLITLCFGALVYGLAANRGGANRLFSTPFAVWLGEISFPLYLVHVMVLSWLRFRLYADHAGQLEKVTAIALVTVFIFALAWLLHLYVERPTHRLARRAIEPPGLGAPAPATSAS